MTQSNIAAKEASELLIVIVNYFMAEECCQLIESIIKAKRVEIKRIICVDNSCDTQQWDLLEQLQKNLKNDVFEIQANPENRGFGAAINLVVREQISLHESFNKILLINPDVYLNDNSLGELLAGTKYCPDAGIWGGVTIDENGKADGFHAWREPTILREIARSLLVHRFYPLDAFVSDYLNIHEKLNTHAKQNKTNRLTHYSVDAVSGCFLLIDRSLWQNLHGFDERFFLYSEEIDLCQRARTLGAMPQVINHATISHTRGTSTEFSDRINLVLNSKLLYWQKHHGNFSKLLVRIIYACGFFGRGICFFLVPKKWNHARELLKLSGKLFLNKSLSDR